MSISTVILTCFRSAHYSRWHWLCAHLRSRTIWNHVLILICEITFFLNHFQINVIVSW